MSLPVGHGGRGQGGLGEAPQPFTLQEVPPNPWRGFRPAHPTARLGLGGCAGKDAPGTWPGRSNQGTGAGKGAKTARERGDAKGAGLLPSRDLVAREGRPRLIPCPAATAGLAGEAAMEAKCGCAGGRGGHPWVPCPPPPARLFCSRWPRQECQECEIPAGLPCCPHPGCPLLLRPVTRTGYSPE